MNFITMPFLITSLATCLGLSILMLVISRNEKVNNELLMIGISTLFVLAAGGIYFFGYTEDTANGVKINEDNTISLYYVTKDETYVQKVKRIGTTKISYYKDKNPAINKKVTIKRSIHKGTQINAPESSKDTLSANEEVDTDK